ncbi:Pentatricopeptide repeat-containing protein [Thalictrum thalictroides]|uniref:Pentatricopeptide repeat-containing protein n=1 Tax=Thalictrum thalictroides TaxID=46969 RepID=A0A7J6WJK9_THATH|nr:Pentatricopeptide repeat-containing protein [Thalictrum thalictroides]
MIFPVGSNTTLETIATFGAMFFLFTSGVKTDPGMIRQNGRKSIVVGFLAFLTPLVLAVSLALILTKFIPMDKSLADSLHLIAGSQALTGFIVIACHLTELKIVNTDLGRLAVSAAIVGDLLGISTTAIYFASQQSKADPMDAILGILTTLLLVAFIVYVIRPLTLYMIKGTPGGTTVKQVHVFALFLTVLVVGFFSETVGQHFVLGPLILGLALPDGPPLGSELVEKLDSLVSFLLFPTYLAILKDQEFALTVLSVLLLTTVISPLMRALYDPSKRFISSKKNNIQHAKRNAELRILVCIHKQENVPSILNILEISHPTIETPISVIILQIIELMGRYTPILVAHKPDHNYMCGNVRTQNIVNAFTQFEMQSQGITSIHPFTAIAHFATMHDDICNLAIDKRNNYNEVYSNNRRINNFVKAGNFDSALQLFEEMTTRDAVSFNLMITAHARYGYSQEGFHLYKNMVSIGIKEKETPFTFSSVLSICSDLGFYQEGSQVHCRAILLGFDLDLFVGSALVNLYMQCKVVNAALQLFDELPERNVATWNSILRGFCGLGCSDELLDFFLKMKWDGVEPNEVTLSYVIHGCSVGQFLNQGKQLHCHVFKLGWVESNMFVANALVDFYSSCGSLIDARNSFECILPEDVISWNSIIYVFANHGLSLEAIGLFGRMQSWGKKPSIRSFVGFLNFSSETRNVILGEQIHGFVLKVGFDQAGNHVRSALIDMYGKCRKIESSVALFEGNPERSIECCNSLMTSLLHCGIVEDVIELFGLMVDEGIGIDHVTFSTTLKALSLSASASLVSCEVIHCCAIRSGFESNVVVSCSLIDAYSRSGHIKLSSQIFEQILEPNLICFTSLITGYARCGMGKEGLEMLKLLIKKGLKPDQITFLSVLTGCSHSGLVEEGLSMFELMKTVYGILPDQRHYSCMVDLLGRAGLLKEAEDLLKLPELKGDSVLWSSLLLSCRIHRNKEVGNRAAEALMELQPNDPAAYVQASGFYSDIGDVETSMKIREMKMLMKLRKELGCSLIEISNHN